MKTSFECVDIINELLEDIHLYGLDEKCVVFSNRKNGILTEYLLQKEFNEKSDFYIDEKREIITLFETLVAFIKQNSVIERPEIAYKLIAIRNIAGLSQSEISKKLYIDPKNYGQWETGNRNPKLENLMKICTACNVDVKYII